MCTTEAFTDLAENAVQPSTLALAKLAGAPHAFAVLLDAVGVLDKVIEDGSRRQQRSTPNRHFEQTSQGRLPAGGKRKFEGLVRDGGRTETRRQGFAGTDHNYPPELSARNHPDDPLESAARQSAAQRAGLGRTTASVLSVSSIHNLIH